jgi:hypothetical protein
MIRHVSAVLWLLSVVVAEFWSQASSNCQADSQPAAREMPKNFRLTKGDLAGDARSGCTGLYVGRYLPKDVKKDETVAFGKLWPAPAIQPATATSFRLFPLEDSIGALVNAGAEVHIVNSTKELCNAAPVLGVWKQTGILTAAVQLDEACKKTLDGEKDTPKLVVGKYEP